MLGKQLFDDLRASLTALQRDLDRSAADARHDLNSAAGRLQLVGLLLAIGLVVLLLVLAFGLRRVVLRPLSALTAEVRRVAGGGLRCGGARQRPAGDRRARCGRRGDAPPDRRRVPRAAGHHRAAGRADR
jgi:hypothetical protein